MAYRRFLSGVPKVEIPGGIPTVSKVLRLIKQMVNHEQFDFYELETFEVRNVLLNYDELPLQADGQPDYSYYGAVSGNFVVEKNQKVKPESGPQLVRPLDSKIKNYPLGGECVIVGNYNGKSYYWNTLNIYNSANENSVPGISQVGTSSTPPIVKFGKKFKKDKIIRQVKAEEGDLILHGRFGNSINLGSNNNNSLIKIRSGQRTDLNTPLDDGVLDGLKNVVQQGGPIPEDINEDKNSIYLSTSGRHEVTNTGDYDGDLIGKDNCIIINSDSLIFNGRAGKVNIRASKNLYLEGEEVFINATKAGTIKMGDPKAPMIPTVRGDVMLQFQSDILTLFSDFQQVLLLVATPPAFLAKAKLLVDKIVRMTEVITKLKFLNMQVMTADPDFKIPETPKFPKIPKVPEGIPKVPSIPKELDITKLKQ